LEGVFVRAIFLKHLQPRGPPSLNPAKYTKLYAKVELPTVIGT